MANTIMSAKNSFQDGLIMDFAPDNTQATCLTSALNATLLTFNGNEMSLLNDMGNGRVETAYLPDGYIPVGTCEFGDIVYIVSYNPLTDQSLIGCFPSPERNISSQEIYYLGDLGYQRLNCGEFQELDSDDNPTGMLRTTAVKKVLIDKKNLNPGDKYIIYTSQEGLGNNVNCLSDFHLDSEPNKYHRYLKLHIVSIDDAGKITYLDTTTKWYGYLHGEVTGKYYIDSQASKNINGNMVPDIDSYRNTLLSGWSIFSSKVSGKLAILAELEMINTFSCSYELISEKYENNAEYKEEENYRYKKYKINIIPDWEGDVDPYYILVNDAYFNNPEKGKNKIETYLNNKIGHEPVKKGLIEIGEVEVPYKEKIDNKWVDVVSSDIIYNLEIIPAMEYGILNHLAIDIEIDFRLVGKGEAVLTEWRYYNTETTAMLQYGLNVYPEPLYEIEKVTILFFDNIELVGEYYILGKDFRSGVHIEQFGLNGEANNYKFSRYNSHEKDEKGENKIIKHPGTLIDNFVDDNIDYYKNSDEYCLYDAETRQFVENPTESTTYNNDAGTLYSGYLYLAKILVIQKHKESGTTKECSPSYRWFWTNTMFNEYFYLVGNKEGKNDEETNDFKKLDFVLALDGNAIFESDPIYFQWKYKELNNLSNAFIEDNRYKTYSANTQYIGKDGSSNIRMYVNAGLYNDYNCFNLNQASLEDINLDIYLGTSRISYDLSDKQYEFSDKETSVNETYYLSLKDVINKNGFNEILLFEYLDNPTKLTEKRITSDNDNITDNFNIYFSSTMMGDLNIDTPNIDDDGDGILDTIAPKSNGLTLAQCYYMSETYNKALPLVMKAILFNKAYVQDVYDGYLQVPVYTPIINSEDDLRNLGIVAKLDEGRVKLAFNTGMCISLSDKHFTGVDLHYDEDLMRFDSATEDDKNHGFDVDSDKIVNTSSDVDFIDKIWSSFSSRMGLFFPVYLGGNSATDKYNALRSGTDLDNTEDWQLKRSFLSNLESSVQSSLLSNGVFNIAGTDISNVKLENAISFLGMKYRDGMTLLNSAFIDSDSGEGKDFLLNDRKVGYYSNFAYLLYLILSNTYHKDKRVDDLEVNIKNYVRNGNYTVNLSKNIIIGLSLKEGFIHNILVRRIPFNEIMAGFDAQFEESEINDAGNNNITLILKNCAKNNELKVLVKSLPMLFFNTDIDAYIMRNGTPIPHKNLANTFYIYLEGLLLLFTNKTLIFPKDDVITNLLYLLNNNSITDLLGARVGTYTTMSDYDQAFNSYLGLIREWVLSNRTSMEKTGYYEALSQKEDYISNMIYNMTEFKFGYSKETIILDMREEFFNDLFVVVLDGDLYIFVINNLSLLDDYYKYPDTEKLNYYEINTYLNLNLFKYENGLLLNPSGSLSTFGALDGAEKEYKSGYGGFIRNVVLDLNYQVVKK